MTTILPKLAVFDLDCTVWPFFVTIDVRPPFRKIDATDTSPIQAKDVTGKILKLFPDVIKILDDLKRQNIPCAIASRAGGIIRAQELLKLFEIDSYFCMKQIYPAKKTGHFMQFKEQGYAPDECIFFDDEPRNHEDLKPCGVFGVLVSDETGVTWEVYLKAMSDYSDHKRQTESKDD